MYNYSKSVLEVRKSRVIYADTLLLVNFSMDFLAIYITVKLTRGVVRPIRMASSAAVGAVWALVAELLEVYCTGVFAQILMLIAHLACASLIIAVAQRTSVPNVGQTVTFIAVNIGLGGVMTALYSLVGSVFDTSDLQGVSSDAPSAAVFVVAAAIAGAVSLIYGKFRARSLDRKKVQMTLTVLGNTAAFEALCDSGNFLCEPFSGRPVVILSAKRMEGRLPGELIAAAHDHTKMVDLQECRVRLIPTSTVTGGGMMLCFTPTRMCIEGKAVDAVAAIDLNSEGYGGCDGIVGQTLLNV